MNTLTQTINILRKVFTFGQFDSLANLCNDMAKLSAARNCDQQVILVFRHGHVEFVNATNNGRSVMDEQYQWEDIE